MMVFEMTANPSQSNSAFLPAQVAESQIWSRGKRDRDAVLSWLTGNGRGALYSRGATNAVIGGKRVTIDFGYSPPTPNLAQGWRKVPFVPEALTVPRPGDISIVNGWSMIKRDATIGDLPVYRVKRLLKVRGPHSTSKLVCNIIH